MTKLLKNIVNKLKCHIKLFLYDFVYFNRASGNIKNIKNIFYMTSYILI